MLFTLDTNCLIDVEENRPNAPFIREIVSRHGKGINVAISAIGASERQRSGRYAQNFSEFKDKRTAIGLQYLELLPPVLYFDVCFFDHWVLANENDTLESQIHAILFPSIEFLWVDFAKAHGLPVDNSALDKTWRNAKCDVLGLWCHIKHGGGVFVTSDRNFHAATKQAGLKALGVGVIAYPKDAATLAAGVAGAI